MDQLVVKVSCRAEQVIQRRKRCGGRGGSKCLVGGGKFQGSQIACSSKMDFSICIISYSRVYVTDTVPLV